MNLETYIMATVASAVLVLFAIIQPGLPHDRRRFGQKTYSSVEGMFMVWGGLALMAGVFGRVFSVVLDIAGGIRNTQILTADDEGTPGCSDDGSCTRGLPSVGKASVSVS